MGCRRQAGFTLIELVVLCAILAIVAGLAIPRYGQAMIVYRADSAARTICQDLHLARQRAKSLSQPVTVAFDPDEATLTISGLADRNDPDRDHFRDFSAQPYGVWFSVCDFAGDATVVFNGFGLPDSDGTIRIRCNTQARTIVLDAQSGEARVQ
jgi:type II secretory pathway pseudopilin PulG